MTEKIDWLRQRQDNLTKKIQKLTEELRQTQVEIVRELTFNRILESTTQNTGGMNGGQEKQAQEDS